MINTKNANTTIAVMSSLSMLLSTAVGFCTTVGDTDKVGFCTTADDIDTIGDTVAVGDIETIGDAETDSGVGIAGGIAGIAGGLEVVRRTSGCAICVGVTDTDGTTDTIGLGTAVGDAVPMAVPLTRISIASIAVFASPYPSADSQLIGITLFCRASEI